MEYIDLANMYISNWFKTEFYTYYYLFKIDKLKSDVILRKRQITISNLGEKCMRRNLNEVIRLNDEQKKQLGSEIKAFYLDVRGEEIGMIEEQQLIDLFCEHLAPIVYNKALDDSMRWLKEQFGNLETDYYLLYKDV